MQRQLLLLVDAKAALFGNPHVALRQLRLDFDTTATRLWRAFLQVPAELVEHPLSAAIAPRRGMMLLERI